MNIRELLSQPWLSDDVKPADVVISSRIRLARNLKKWPFPKMASAVQRENVEKLVVQAIEALPNKQNNVVFHLQELSEMERIFLFERHLISRDHALGAERRAVVLNAQEHMSMMINEEDHMRLQVFYPGLKLDSSWQACNHWDDELLQRLDVAYSPDKGFLTECPTNVGTGLRASVMLHLPGLVFFKNAQKLFEAIAKLGLTVRGIYGEGSSAAGHMFQISNQVTLGLSELDIIQKLKGVVQQVIAQERIARERLLKNSRLKLEDKVYRSLGILQNSRLLSYAEAIDLLSTIWLGCGINMVSGLKEKNIYELFFLVQPAHIQMLEGASLSSDVRDEKRAQLVRRQLGEI